jgi:hypothetical protein
VAGAALAASQAHAAGPEMVVNGSFESPAHDTPGTYSGGGDNWILGLNSPVVIVNGNIVDGDRHHYGRTPYGKQYLGMDPRSAQGWVALDSQVIPGFVAGQSYLVTLDAADSDGGKAPVLEVILSDGGSTTYARRKFGLPVAGPYGTFIQFQKLHILFKAPVTGSVTLTLENAGDTFSNPDPGSISVDKVSVVALSAAEAAAIQAEDAEALQAPAEHSSGFAR